MVNHLPAFSIQALAQISDWLDEKGELCVDIYFLRSGSGSTDQYFIRSMRDLMYLVFKQGWPAIVFTIYHESSFPLFGVANRDLLERALQEIPEGKPFYILDFAYYPDRIQCRYIEDEGLENFALIHLIHEKWGHLIGLGPAYPFWFEEGDFGAKIDVRSDPRSPQESFIYAPYEADPARYQWIVEMWQE